MNFDSSTIKSSNKILILRLRCSNTLWVKLEAKEKTITRFQEAG